MVVVRTKNDAITLEHVAGAHWDRVTLYVYLVGGKFISLAGVAAHAFWDVYTQGGIDAERDADIERNAGTPGVSAFTSSRA